MSEWEQAIHDFYEVYRRLEKKYRLTHAYHFSEYTGNWFQVWSSAEGEKRQIVRITTASEDDVICWIRAKNDLLMYEKWEQEKRDKETENKMRLVLASYMANQQKVIRVGKES